LTQEGRWVWNPAKLVTTNVIVSASRAVIGFLFACHGAASLFGAFGGAKGTHGGTAAFGTWPSWWAAVIQIISGGLVMVATGHQAGRHSLFRFDGLRVFRGTPVEGAVPDGERWRTISDVRMVLLTHRRDGIG
jgi:hypothetical protein